MAVLLDSDLSDTIKTMIMNGGVLTLISPYISDFKGWGDTKGSKVIDDRKYLTELLVSATLEEDGRVIIITDKESKNRFYSKGIIDEIKKRDDTFWIYLYEIDKLHAKLFFKSKMAVVGSSNMTFPALKKNIELGVFIDNNDDLLLLREFIGELIINSDSLNEQAKILKQNLKKTGLLKKEIIFDIVELIAHSHYLYRTTKIHCIWESLEEPKILSKLAFFLDKFDDERKITDKRLPEVYEPKKLSKKDLLWEKYAREELKIKGKKIKDVLELWNKYFSGKITKPINLNDFRINYENPIKLPDTKTFTVDMHEILSELIEERMKSPIRKIKR